MANRVETSLSTELQTYLQQERYVAVSTVDHETGGPAVRAISWVYAIGDKQIRFSIDNRSRLVEDIKANDQIVLTVICKGSTYAISGRGRIFEEKMSDVPIKLALIETEVIEVRDIMFYGGKMTAEPDYEKMYDAEAAAKLDSQVMNALKRA
ncbi:pyridoxamine 5'-phosphate oxidase family protein [Alteribacillus sp. HJP-4]|uniref:pyridoxamine 5'-phosphate oxidase family protein n=1 Tax=Alteribacillus sp. HJP-4 TaxID=2775394 RepID=UPI0035CCDF04